jgi:hypothetical protein
VVPRYGEARTWNGYTFTNPHFGQLFGTEQRPIPAADVATLATSIRALLPG